MTTFALDEDREPWEKQSGETMNAFMAYAIFRDLGPARTLPKTVDAHGKSLSMIQKWSQKYRWFERAEAYDLMVDARHRQQTETIREQILGAHRLAGQLGVNALIERMRGRQPGTRGPDDPGLAPLDPETIEWSDVPRLMGESVKTQRLAIGEPTDYVKGGLSLTPPQVQEIVRDVVEICMRYVPMDRANTCFADVQAYFDRGGEQPRSQPRALTA